MIPETLAEAVKMMRRLVSDPNVSAEERRLAADVLSKPGFDDASLSRDDEGVSSQGRPTS